MTWIYNKIAFGFFYIFWGIQILLWKVLFLINKVFEVVFLKGINLILFRKENPKISDISFQNTTFLYSFLVILSIIIILVALIFLTTKMGDSDNKFAHYFKAVKKVPVIFLLLFVTPFIIYGLSVLSNLIFYWISLLNQTDSNANVEGSVSINSSLSRIVWFKTGMWNEWTREEDAVWWRNLSGNENSSGTFAMDMSHFERLGSGSGTILIIKSTVYVIVSAMFFWTCIKTTIQILFSLFSKTIFLPIVMTTSLKQDDGQFKQWMKNYFGHFASLIGITFIYNFFPVVVSLSDLFARSIFSSYSDSSNIVYIAELLLFYFFGSEYSVRAFKEMSKLIIYFGLENDVSMPTNSKPFGLFKKLNPASMVMKGAKKFADKRAKPNIKAVENTKTKIQTANDNLKIGRTRTTNDSITNKAKNTVSNTKAAYNTNINTGARMNVGQISTIPINENNLIEASNNRLPLQNNLLESNNSTASTNAIVPVQKQNNSTNLPSLNKMELEKRQNQLIQAAQETNKATKEDVNVLSRKTSDKAFMSASNQRNEAEIQHSKIEYFDKKKEDSKQNSKQNIKTTNEDKVLSLLTSKLDEINKNIILLNKKAEKETDSKSKQGDKNTIQTTQIEANIETEINEINDIVEQNIQNTIEEKPKQNKTSKNKEKEQDKTLGTKSKTTKTKIEPKKQKTTEPKTKKETKPKTTTKKKTSKSSKTK